jgi:hypothetical protein
MEVRKRECQYDDRFAVSHRKEKFRHAKKFICSHIPIALSQLPVVKSENILVICKHFLHNGTK